MLYDRSQSIRESVRDVQISLLLALALVVGVIFVFLRSARATLIPSLALPMSIVGTFALMYVFGYNIDNLSLMALTLCVGFVVDDAIVMLENITRHMEMGKPRMQATLDGSKEIGFTIVSMTIVAGRGVHPGAVHGRHPRPSAARVRRDDHRRGAALGLRVADADAAAVQPHAENRARRGRTGVSTRLPGRMFDRLLAGIPGEPYFRARTSAARRCSAFGALFVATGVLFTYMPKGFLPSDDVGQLFVFTEAAQDISFDAMSKLQRQVAAIVRRNPHVESVMSFVGGGGSGSSLNSGRMFVTLKPREERPTADVVVQELRPALATCRASRRSCRTCRPSASAS